MDTNIEVKPIRNQVNSLNTAWAPLLLGCSPVEPVQMTESKSHKLRNTQALKTFDWY